MSSKSQREREERERREHDAAQDSSDEEQGDEQGEEEEEEEEEKQNSGEQKAAKDGSGSDSGSDSGNEEGSSSDEEDIQPSSEEEEEEEEEDDDDKKKKNKKTSGSSSAKKSGSSSKKKQTKDLTPEEQAKKDERDKKQQRNKDKITQQKSLMHAWTFLPVNQEQKSLAKEREQSKYENAVKRHAQNMVRYKAKKAEAKKNGSDIPDAPVNPEEDDRYDAIRKRITHQHDMEEYKEAMVKYRAAKKQAEKDNEDAPDEPEKPERIDAEERAAHKKAMKKYKAAMEKYKVAKEKAEANGDDMPDKPEKPVKAGDEEETKDKNKGERNLDRSFQEFARRRGVRVLGRQPTKKGNSSTKKPKSQKSDSKYERHIGDDVGPALRFVALGVLNEIQRRLLSQQTQMVAMKSGIGSISASGGKKPKGVHKDYFVVGPVLRVAGSLFGDNASVRKAVTDYAKDTVIDYHEQVGKLPKSDDSSKAPRMYKYLDLPLRITDIRPFLMVPSPRGGFERVSQGALYELIGVVAGVLKVVLDEADKIRITSIVGRGADVRAEEDEEKNAHKTLYGMHIKNALDRLPSIGAYVKDLPIVSNRSGVEYIPDEYVLKLSRANDPMLKAMAKSGDIQSVLDHAKDYVQKPRDASAKKKNKAKKDDSSSSSSSSKESSSKKKSNSKQSSKKKDKDSAKKSGSASKNGTGSSKKKSK